MVSSTEDIISLYAQLEPNKMVAREMATNESWTYQEFDQAIARLASALQKQGCEYGERIVVLARNTVQQIMLHFACSRLGLIFAPMNWRLSSAELSVLLEIATPKLLFADVASSPLLGDRGDLVLLDDFVKESQECDPLAKSLKDFDRPSLLLFTSGTTSKPKGVLLSERNLEMTGVNFGILSKVNEESCFLCESPMFHVIGIVTNIRPVLQKGGSILVSDGFKPDRTLKWMADSDLGITHYMGVPQMIESFRQEPGFNPKSLQHMTAIVTGGAPHKASDIQSWLEEGISIVSGFGMSEAGTILGMPTNIDAIKQKLGSVGVTTPWMQTKIVKANGEECAPNEPGELWIRGDNVMHAYLNNPEATSAVMTEDGWFKTGDILSCDEDGYFWVVDRKKDMYISGGENIYPAEIEAILVDYPETAEVAVAGIPDKKWGEVGCVFAVPKISSSFDEQDLLDYLKPHLAKYKWPKRVVVIDNLPRTSTGKVQKAKLLALLTN
jgi:fatty-acyl-CoA synthase